MSRAIKGVGLMYKIWCRCILCAVKLNLTKLAQQQATKKTSNKPTKLM